MGITNVDKENRVGHKEGQLVESAMNMIVNEHIKLVHAISYDEVAQLIPFINGAKRIFLMGSGRTGFMIRAAAMRLMHLGYRVHVVGETTSPAIEKGDLLIAGSGSGTTTGIVRAAQTAREEGAQVVCLTTNPESTLAKLAAHSVVIAAAEKQAQDENVSKQYAGSLFEQSLLLVFDALIQTLWRLNGSSTEELWSRHANME